ncbi:unnamed protein product, partial [Mesorhabditis spiculigera]
MPDEEENTDVEGTATKFDAPPEDAGQPLARDADEEIYRVGKTELAPATRCTDEEIAEKRQFWRKRLADGPIKYIVAPMVDQSELAFRMMMKAHGAHLTFTPMIHAHLFVNDTTYRRNALSFCAKDRPLVVQFCANKPDTFLAACRLVEGYCDGVDLNLGCPQMVAKRGRYGSYLQDEVDLICTMVRGVRDYCRLPVSCKIRIRECRQQTVQYARRLVDAGASMLTVHGRTREMKGAETGIADWSRIKDVVDAVDVPVIGNGNIQMAGDVERCMAETGVVGVMSAEGILNNPLLFTGQQMESSRVAEQYLEFAKKFEAGVSAIRAHIFRICHHSMLEYPDLRKRLGVVFRMADFDEIVAELRARTTPIALEPDNVARVQKAAALFEEIRNGHRTLDIVQVAGTPHWLVKPYFRLAELAKERQGDDDDGPTYKEKRKEELKELAEKHGLSLKQVRKRERRQISMERKFHRTQQSKYTPCARCGQPSGQGCAGIHCRKCCRWTCKRDNADCKTHRYKFSHLLLAVPTLPEAPDHEEHEADA